jgi:hypothetical protein
VPRRRSALVDRLVVDQPGRSQHAILAELRRVNVVDRGDLREVRHQDQFRALELSIRIGDL